MARMVRRFRNRFSSAFLVASSGMRSALLLALITEILFFSSLSGSSKEMQIRRGERGLHLMISSASIDGPLGASLRASVSADFAGQATRTLVPGGEALVMIAATELDRLQAAVLGTVPRWEGRAPDPAITDPEILAQQKPEFPSVVLQSGWDGCPHALLAKSSLKALIDGWSFRPATRDGKPVAMAATVEVSYAKRVSQYR
jgi:hypothetical protein